MRGGRAARWLIPNRRRPARMHGKGRRSSALLPQRRPRRPRARRPRRPSHGNLRVGGEAARGVETPRPLEQAGMAILNRLDGRLAQQLVRASLPEAPKHGVAAERLLACPSRVAFLATTALVSPVPVPGGRSSRRLRQVAIPDLNLACRNFFTLGPSERKGPRSRALQPGTRAASFYTASNAADRPRRTG